jgi:hypothetical protein
MARPRTPIGTFGEIEFKKLPNGTIRARTRFRDHDGQLRHIEASGDTRTRAEHRLKEKLAARNGYSTGFGELTPDSPFSQLVEIWLEDLDLEGKLAESTGAPLRAQHAAVGDAGVRESPAARDLSAKGGPVHQAPRLDQELQHGQAGADGLEPRPRIGCPVRRPPREPRP